jgi:Uma2 family endonuclease
MLDFVVDRGTLSQREYNELVERGVFKYAPVELLDGRIVVMSPQSEWHSDLTDWLAEKLMRALDERYSVRRHSPFIAGRRSMPEPDISVSLRRKRQPSHPRKALLIIEVAGSSLARDRDIKAAIYAGNGAAEYWIVDVKARCVWVHTEPAHGTYKCIVKLGRRDKLVPTKLLKVALSIADLFATR